MIVNREREKKNKKKLNVAKKKSAAGGDIEGRRQAGKRVSGTDKTTSRLEVVHVWNCFTITVISRRWKRAWP